MSREDTPARRQNSPRGVARTSRGGAPAREAARQDQRQQLKQQLERGLEDSEEEDHNEPCWIPWPEPSWDGYVAAHERYERCGADCRSGANCVTAMALGGTLDHAEGDGEGTRRHRGETGGPL